jgi:GMP synthase-like glutamine amidotransferase
LGIQFHPEVTPEIIRAMIEHEGWELVDGVDASYVQSAEEMLALAAGPDFSFLTDWL